MGFAEVNSRDCLSRQEILFPLAEKVFKKATADMKVAKIKLIPLKEKNLSRFYHRDSNSFSFLALHDLDFLTHFHVGGYMVHLVRASQKSLPTGRQASIGLTGYIEKTPMLFLTRFLLSFHRMEKKEPVSLEDKS